MNGTSAAEGEAIAFVIESEWSWPVSPPETGSTDQYQPEFGSRKPQIAKVGSCPSSAPLSVTPTEPIRLNRCAERRLSKPRSLAWR